MPSAYADILISYIDESSLPYEYSPSKYDNSPSKYDNSISKYDNSSSKYDNSPSKYDNSPSKNGANSENRLLIKDGSSLYRVGYYVYNGSGVTNFYSTSGKRMFYNPQETVAVFNGSNGAFSGIFAILENEYHLFLTETGMKALYMSQ